MDNKKILVICNALLTGPEMDMLIVYIAERELTAYKNGRQDGIKSIGLDEQELQIGAGYKTTWGDTDYSHDAVAYGYNEAVSDLEQQKQAKLKE